MAGRRAGRHHLDQPPPVAVTLESLAAIGRAGPVPAGRDRQCEGNIVQAVGNFSAYTNKKAPIVAVLKFFYGLTVPPGTVYMLKPNGKTVVKLAPARRASPGTTPLVSTVPSRSSARPPTTPSTPRTPSTSPVPTRPWDANKRSEARIRAIRARLGSHRSGRYPMCAFRETVPGKAGGLEALNHCATCDRHYLRCLEDHRGWFWAAACCLVRKVVVNVQGGTLVLRRRAEEWRITCV